MKIFTTERRKKNYFSYITSRKIEQTNFIKFKYTGQFAAKKMSYFFVEQS